MSFSGNQYPNFADKVISTRGDIIRGNSSGERARYGIGAANTVLTSDGTDPAWAAHGGVPTTTKGDISGFSTTQARIPISTNNYSLLADSAQTLGLKWAASSTSTLTTTGDLLAASAANTLSRIAGGASGEVLTGNGAGVLPTFQAAGGGGSWTFLESFTNPSEQDFFSCELATDYVYADNEFLVIAINGRMTATAAYPNNLGIGYHIATTGTTYLNSDNFSIGNVTVNPVYVGYGGYFAAAKACSLIVADSATWGSGYAGLSTDQAFTATMWLTNDQLGNPTHAFPPMYFESFNGASGNFGWGVGYHEFAAASNPTTISAIRFFATEGTGYTEETNGMGINSTCAFWKVANS